MKHASTNNLVCIAGETMLQGAAVNHAPAGNSAGWHGGWLPRQAGMHLQCTIAKE